MATDYVTRFGSLDDFEKGSVEVIDDDPKHYAFSNAYEVAANSRPYEKVCVAKNMEYVIEVLRAEGTSQWRAARHDEFALVMGGEVSIELRKLADPDVVPEDTAGSVGLQGEPEGQRMGRVRARRGHMVLLPAGAAYRFDAEVPGVVLLQTTASGDTVYRWAEICQTL